MITNMVPILNSMLQLEKHQSSAHNATTVLSSTRTITTHSTQLSADLETYTKSLSSALLGLHNATEAHQASALGNLEAAGS